MPGALLRAAAAFVGVACATVASPAAAQSVAAGEKAFKVCSACHAVGPGAVNKFGPVLNGIAGRKAGAYPGYSYSGANKTSGLTWNEATFKAYIKHPAAVVPGTKMMFAGIPREREIESLWLYLRQFAADGEKQPRTLAVRAGKSTAPK